METRHETTGSQISKCSNELDTRYKNKGQTTEDLHLVVLPALTTPVCSLYRGSNCLHFLMLVRLKLISCCAVLFCRLKYLMPSLAKVWES